ncbi:10251_t:CDS:1, partial [Paraglomus occultum]
MDTPPAPPLSNDASSVAQQEPPAALPEVYHEGIPESVESERLSELKKVASERASREGPCVTKGSPAALA